LLRKHPRNVSTQSSQQQKENSSKLILRVLSSLLPPLAPNVSEALNLDAVRALQRPEHASSSQDLRNALLLLQHLLRHKSKPLFPSLEEERQLHGVTAMVEEEGNARVSCLTSMGLSLFPEEGTSMEMMRMMLAGGGGSEDRLRGLFSLMRR